MNRAADPCGRHDGPDHESAVGTLGGRSVSLGANPDLVGGAYTGRGSVTVLGARTHGVADADAGGGASETAMSQETVVALRVTTKRYRDNRGYGLRTRLEVRIPTRYIRAAGWSMDTVLNVRVRRGLITLRAQPTPPPVNL